MNKDVILIVEDNEDDYIVISRLIKTDYSTIYDDGNGDIFQLIEKHKPACILLDYNLGNISGSDLLKKIKTESNFSNMPVIMLTGEKNPDVIVSCMKNGASDYLGKGDFGKVELLSKIENAIENANLHLKIKEQQNTLNQNEINLRTLFNAMTDEVFEIDYNGKYLFAAPTTPKRIIMPINKLIGQTLHEIFPKEEADQFLGFVRACLDENSPNTIEYPLTINAETIWYEGRAIPKTKNSILYIARDITKRKKTETQLKEHAIQLQERNEELDAFSHTVAHDLKSPLSTMISFADLLYEEYSTLGNNEIKEFLNTIIESGNKTQQIINSLLLFANVRKADVPAEVLNMTEIIVEANKRLAPMISSRNAKFIISHSWPTAIGYAPWIEEIWTNYISNALKYGGSTPVIEIGADVFIIDGGKKMSRFWVRDNGKGISLEDQKTVFRQFERLDQVKIKGHGLGLSIVRRIIEKLGGEVGVESNQDEGSLFYFTLPIK